MDRDIIIGILAALPGIIALILYIIDSYKDRYRISVIKNKIIWRVDLVERGHLISSNIIKTNDELLDSLKIESNKFVVQVDIIISNIGRRPMTLNKLRFKLADYENSIELKELKLLKTGESYKEKIKLYLGDTYITKKAMNSKLIITVTDHRDKLIKINLGKITI